MPVGGGGGDGCCKANLTTPDPNCWDRAGRNASCCLESHSPDCWDGVLYTFARCCTETRYAVELPWEELAAGLPLQRVEHLLGPKSFGVALVRGIPGLSDDLRNIREASGTMFSDDQTHIGNPPQCINEGSAKGARHPKSDFFGQSCSVAVVMGGGRSYRIPHHFDNASMLNFPAEAFFHNAGLRLARKIKGVLSRLLEDVDAYVSSTAKGETLSLLQRLESHPMMHVVHHAYPAKPQPRFHSPKVEGPRLNHSQYSMLHGFHADAFWASVQLQPVFEHDYHKAQTTPQPLSWFEDSTLALNADRSLHRLPQLGPSDAAIWFGRFVGEATRGRIWPSRHGVYLPSLYRPRWKYQNYRRKVWLVHAWPAGGRGGQGQDEVLEQPCLTFCGQNRGEKWNFGARVNVDVSSA